MKISYNWLKRYVPELPEVEKLTDVFTFHICEVESVEKIGNDSVFDIKVLPDRAHDLLSHRGVARDLAGILGLKYNEPAYENPLGDETELKITLETENCRRYVGRILRDIKVGPSPAWMVEYLNSMGQRSINNLVDATNIVMFGLGQPIHIFDLAKVQGGINVRNAKENEVLTTLDDKEIKLNPKNMVIADETRALAIAGIKGGKFAEVDENTKDIIIEVANFDPTSVRKTAKEIHLYTDAVKRFENDFSPEVALYAMSEIVALILEMCPSVKIEKIVDVYPKKQIENKLTFNLSKVSKILGVIVQPEEVEKIFKNYGLEYEIKGEEITFIPAKERLDLKIDEDMAEEIGRVLGYDKIEAKIPEINVGENNWVKETGETFAKINWARNKLLDDGYSEVMTYAFCDKGEVEVLASASNKKFLRTNLADGLKESLKLNQLNAPFLEMKEIKIFEIGTVFKKDTEEISVAYNEKKNIVEKTLDEFVEVDRDAFSEWSLRGLEEKISIATDSKFKMWSLFPFITRDVAVWIPENEGPKNLKKLLIENATELCVREPYMFDSFTKEGRTSYAFRLVFQSYERTLTDDEVNPIMTNISHKISENSSWQIR